VALHVFYMYVYKFQEKVILVGGIVLAVAAIECG
jgi:hypothetical protein